MNRSWVLVAVVVAACGNKESKDQPAAGSSAPPAAGSAAPSAGAAAAAPDDVGQLVVDTLASNAFGNQKVERRCVTVSPPAAAGTTSVVAAKLLAEPACGDDSARSSMWIYVKPEGGAWKDEFLGPPPACWKGVPAEIADAVAQASGIPKC
jgi:hypothetical protein